jgi:hypothetical protein
MLRFSLIFILTLFISCTACNSGSAKTDNDTVPDSELSDDLSDEVLTEPDETPDIDADANDADEDHTGYPDEDHYDDDIPDFSNKPWLVDHDPYSDRDNFVYEYYGDYDVIPEDPENVRRLWRYEFFGVSGGDIQDMCKWVKPYEACALNYPFEPILVEDRSSDKDKTSIKNPFITSNKCDGFLTPELRWEHPWIYGRDPRYTAKGGRAVFSMQSSYSGIGSSGTYMVDIAKKQLIKISAAYGNMAFNGSLAFMTIYDSSRNTSYPDLPGYVSTVQEVIYYDIDSNKYGRAWYDEKFYGANYVGISDTHAMISYQTKPDAQGEMKVVYTKIGEWKNWKELTKYTTGQGGYVIARFPHMVGSQMVFQNYEIASIFCDLEKGDDGCVKISLEDELTYFPKIIGDRKVVYSAVVDGTRKGLMQVELNKDGTIKSREAIITDARINSVRDVNDDFLLYSIKIGETENGHPISAPCYYRFSDKKIFCIDGGEDVLFTKHYSYLPGGGRYLVYQHYRDIILRDMECYCDHNPDRCPYLDYTPDTQNPKVPQWKE